MSDHTEACDKSRVLCDDLFKCLSREIPNLQRTETTRWCGIFQEGKKRFAYINHKRRLQCIEIWCLGDPAELQEKTYLTIKPRKPTTGGFAKSFQSRFTVGEASDIEDACKLLCQISFKLS